MRLKVGPPLAEAMAIPIHRERKSFNNTRSRIIRLKTSLQIKEGIFTTDLILGMDENNVADLKQMAPAGTEHKIHLLLLKVCQIRGIPVILRPIQSPERL